MKSLIIIFILISIGGYSQNEFNKAYRLDADTKQETFFSGLVTTDSALYLTGIAKIDTPTNTYYQTGFFARLDTNGNLIFAKTYGNPQQTREFIYNNLKMSENGILYTNYENQEYSIGFAEVNTLGEAILLKDYYPQAPNAILSISKEIGRAHV